MNNFFARGSLSKLRTRTTHTFVCHGKTQAPGNTLQELTSIISQLDRTTTARAMHIQSIPMCKSINHGRVAICFKILINGTGVGSSNNYAYLVVDDKSKDAVIIDPANPPE